MELKVGDKVRIISYEEALEVYGDNDIIYFGFFEIEGNKVFYVTGADKNTVRLSEGYCVKPESLKKINSFDMKLDENLFEI